MKSNNHILISGNIGSGKSTLAELLSKKLNFTLFSEPYIENPYLSLMYKDMNKWSFHSQLFFLREHHKQHKLIQSYSKTIKDCSIYESVEIFGRNMFQNGYINKTDWELYYYFYETSISSIAPPDLILYLDCPVNKLLERITRRNRDFEKDISAKYLTDLNDLYLSWVNKLKIHTITLDVTNLDFVHNSKDLDSLIMKIF